MAERECVGMSPSDLSHLRAVAASAGPKTTLYALPAHLLRDLLGAYDLVADLNEKVAALQAEAKALRAADADGAGMMERGA